MNRVFLLTSKNDTGGTSGRAPTVSGPAFPPLAGSRVTLLTTGEGRAITGPTYQASSWDESR